MSDEVYKDVLPDPMVFDHHHIVPVSWLPPGQVGETVLVSPNTHRRIHVGIDEALRAGGPQNVEVGRRRAFGKAWPYVVKAFEGSVSSNRHPTLREV